MRVCAHVGGKLTERVREIVAAVRDRKFDYQERPEPEIDWSAYDAAATSELPDVLRLIRRFAETAEANRRPTRPAPRPLGRPRAPAVDVAKAILAQAYLKKANRPAQGLADAFGPRLGIAGAFSYKTIERGYANPDVVLLLEEVFRLTNLPVRGLERVFSVDGSGMVTSVRDNYAAARAKQRGTVREAGDWPGQSSSRVYNVAVIGTEYKLLAAWRATTDPHHQELAQFPDVFGQAIANHPGMGMLLGDGLYAGRPQVDLVAKAGVVPRFLPRRNTTLKRLGVDAWVTMLVAMARDPQRWFSEYHLRSISETGFGVINPDVRIRKRLDARKRTESLAHALVYNLRRLAQLRYLIDLAPLDENYAC